MIGFIGLLPLSPHRGDSPLIKGEGAIRPLSAYYYPARTALGSLWAIGIFLITYKVFESSLTTPEPAFGLAAVSGCSRPSDPRAPAPDAGAAGSQHRVHGALHRGGRLRPVAGHHQLPGIRERTTWRNGRRTRMSPDSGGFHWICSVDPARSPLVVTTRQRWFTHYNLLVGEVVAIMAFGLSWLTKGLELDVLLASEPATGSSVEETAVDARR
jgi:hypothetical protein